MGARRGRLYCPEITDRVVALKEDHSPSLITRRQVVSCLIKLDCGDDIGYSKEVNISDPSNGAVECK
jgi:hypothetical protein